MAALPYSTNSFYAPYTQLVGRDNNGGTLNLQNCRLNLSGNSYGTIHGFQSVNGLSRIVCPVDAEYNTETFYLQVNGRNVTGKVSVGTVNIDDITNLISAYLGDAQATPAYTDMDADGVISIDDITLLINAYLSSSSENSDLEAVDLGLSVKWANMNVGAYYPEDYGDYFAWGETAPKEEYTQENYKFYQDGYYTKYCQSYQHDYNWKDADPEKFQRQYGVPLDLYYWSNYAKITLDMEDDAAYMTWGTSWRMPTPDELAELRSQCAWTEITQNGVRGFKVKGPNGNSIFLSAAGWYDSESYSTPQGVGLCSYFLSNSLNCSDPDTSDNADYLYFISSGPSDGYSYRYRGRTIRAVCP